LGIVSLTVLLCLASAARAEDDALTAAQIRDLIANMDDAGNPAGECDPPAQWSEAMCSIKKAGRKRCLALRDQILASSGDFIVHPVIQTDKYEQIEFDKYAGKCRGTDFDKTRAVINFPVDSVSDRGLRLYIVKAVDPSKKDLLVFGRHYAVAYSRAELEKARAEGKTWLGRSLFSQVDRNTCRVEEIQEVPEPQPNFVTFDRVSVIRIGRVYYIADYHKYLQVILDEPGTLSIIAIGDRFHSLGSAETCDFQ
jgi:hypothetical protein